MGEKQSGCSELNGARNKLLGLALLAFAVVALGAYSFAAGSGEPKPVAAAENSSGEIRTTPDDAVTQEMPPPVTPSKPR